LTDRLAGRYAPQLDGLDQALGLWRHAERPPQPATSRSLLACSCGCGRKLRVARTMLEQGPILCGACQQPFTPERALTRNGQRTAPNELGRHRQPGREGGHER
jgi:hypothetical protein